MLSPIKIAITGASGFIGQHLLEDIDASQFVIRILTRNVSKKMRIFPAGTELVQADLTDFESLKKAFHEIDVIINIAAEVRDSSKMTDTNIIGTQNLIKAAKENKVSKIIHISSVGVVGSQYSNISLQIDEQTECVPSNDYEKTKFESEKLLLDSNKNGAFQLTILRPTNVFGEYHPFKALLHLMNYINSGKPVFCTAHSKVNYLYVKDLTSLIIQLIRDKNEYGIVNAGYPMPLTLFSKAISDLLHKRSFILPIPQFLINFIDSLKIRKLNSVSYRIEYSDKKLKGFYNYPYGLEKGLKRTIEYYHQQNLIK